MVETWSYNPINYYLLIFRSGKIITHIECDEVYDAVSHLLNWCDSKPSIDLLDKEIANILSRNCSEAHTYKDGTFGAVFSSNIINVIEVQKDSEILCDILTLIKSLERDKKLNKILD